MQKLVRGILISALAGAVSLSAQTADEIVTRHLEAMGGRDAISKVKSMTMETTTQMAGNEMSGTATILDGVAFRSESSFNGAKIVQCYTSTGGWIINAAEGITDPTPMPDDQYQAGKGQIYVGGDLYDYAAKGSKIELVGKDASSYTVKLTTQEGVASTYVFDASTYQVKSMYRKTRIHDEDIDTTTSFSDFRKTPGGLLFPYTINVDLGGQFSLTITVTRVEMNKPVDASLCAMPKAGQ